MTLIRVRWVSTSCAAAWASSQLPADGVTALLRKFEQTVQNADGPAFLALLGRNETLAS